MISDKCEAFRTWNRIEGSTRTKNMEESLKAEIYDPLWMLARQWQFGEFEANDCGTAAKVLLSYKESELQSMTLGGKSSPYHFDDKAPEAMVEGETPIIDYKARLQAANQLFKIVSRTLNQAWADKLRKVLTRFYGLKAIGGSKEFENRNDANAMLQSFFSAAQGGVDGFILYQRFKDYLNSRVTEGTIARRVDPKAVRYLTIIITRHSSSQMTSQESDAIAQDIISQFINFFESLHGLDGEKESTWNDSRMEYQFSCRLSDNTQLTVDEYYSGDLDWYHFDLNDASRKRGGQVEKVKEYIPTPLEYAGMPSARWWEIEDAQVDLVNIDADNVDLAKLIVSEYAMMYSNDWMIAPLDVSLGRYIQLNGIIVIDVFGEQTYVDVDRNATLDSPEPWREWNMFGLTNTRNNQSEQGMLLFPSLYSVQESAPQEKLVIAKDEMANMVWAVEELVSDGLGGSKTGKQATEELHKHLGMTKNQDDQVGLQYVLGTTVPEHWIPFIPVKVDNNKEREMKLQRASMPRVHNEQIDKVRPTTSFLRVGITPDNNQSTPFYLHEEEVPAKGITVTRSEQRIRWFDGKTINWQGFRKEAGKGPSASSLKFDSIIDGK